VHALQIGRASSIVPSGSGYSAPPSRHVTLTVGAAALATMATERTEQRRIRPRRGIGVRPPSSIGSSATGDAFLGLRDEAALRAAVPAFSLGVRRTGPQ
jgi:hypothetical protein